MHMPFRQPSGGDGNTFLVLVREAHAAAKQVDHIADCNPDDPKLHPHISTGIHIGVLISDFLNLLSVLSLLQRMAL